MDERKSEILNTFGQKHVEEIWTAFKTAGLHEGITKFVSIKKIGPKEEAYLG